jgi:hypothetical protein
MCSYKSKKNFVSSLSDGHLNGVSIERKRKQKPPPPLPLPHHYAYKHKYLEFRLHICSLFKPKFTLLLFVWKEKGWSHSEHRISSINTKKKTRQKLNMQLTLIFSSWENMGTMPERIFAVFYK